MAKMLGLFLARVGAFAAILLLLLQAIGHRTITPEHALQTAAIDALSASIISSLLGFASAAVLKGLSLLRFVGGLRIRFINWSLCLLAQWLALKMAVSFFGQSPVLTLQPWSLFELAAAFALAAILTCGLPLAITEVRSKTPVSYRGIKTTLFDSLWSLQVTARFLPVYYQVSHKEETTHTYH